jgi:hypothetical protein
MRNVFEDNRFLRSIERWMRIRERPLERESDFVFCSYMYICFDGTLDAVRHWLNTGQKRSWVERAFNEARDLFYTKEVDRYWVPE